MKKTFIQKIGFFLLFIIFKLLFFLDDYVFVGLVVWIERIVKGIVYLLLLGIFGMSIQVVYGAFFSPNAPEIGPAIFLTCIAGILIFLAVVGFKHREKIWSW